MSVSVLDQNEMLRYSRHFPVIGLEGQLQLKNSKILCIGGGGLGCPALQYLAASGVGKLGIMDGDKIELSNLQRQVLFTEQDVGLNKALVLSKRLSALNSQIEIKAYPEFISQTNAEDIIKDYDLVIDASDNYSTRYLLNSVCRLIKKPLVSASISHYEAQLSVFNYKQGPCYQCIYPTPPPAELSPNCSLSGVLGVLPGVAGCLQALEAIKIIIGSDKVLSGTLLSFNLLDMQFKHFTIPTQDCTMHPNIPFTNQESCRTSKTHNDEITVMELAQLISNNSDGVQLLDVRESFEREICHIGGLHIPLPTLTSKTARNNLAQDKLIVVYCKSGGRSAIACQQLKKFGFQEVSNLSGGIMSWIQHIDPRLMPY